MAEELVEKIEDGFAGTTNSCTNETLGFSFKLEEKKKIEFEQRETQSEMATLRVWRGEECCDITIPRLAAPFVAEACQVALARLGEDPNLQTLEGFRQAFKDAVAKIFGQRLTRVETFYGKKGTKIEVKLWVSFGGSDLCCEVNAKTVHGGERYFWWSYFGGNYEKAREVFNLLVVFCESVVVPRVFQVRNFAKGLVAGL